MHVGAWRAAYRGLLPEEVLDALSVEQRTGVWSEWLSATDPAVKTLVATDAEGGIAGFCSIAMPSRDDDATACTAEITATYVDPDRWREGVGTALLGAALAELREAGAHEATLWVLVANAPARAFYARHGLLPDGAESTHEPTGGQPTLRLRIALGAPSTSRAAS